MLARKNNKEKSLTTSAQEEQAKARLYSLENVMALQQALGQGIVWDDLDAEDRKPGIHSKEVTNKAISRNVAGVIRRRMTDLTCNLRAFLQMVFQRGRTNRQTSAR